MNELQVFTKQEFGKIRVIDIDGEPWFVGVDVARILGYTDFDQALRKNVDELDRFTRLVDGGGKQKRERVLLNEAGLYSLIFASKLPAAKQFKRWVFDEVLPSIRKHGLYVTEELLADKERLASELKLLQIELECSDTQVKSLQQLLNDRVWEGMSRQERREAARNGWKL